MCVGYTESILFIALWGTYIWIAGCSKHIYTLGCLQVVLDPYCWRGSQSGAARYWCSMTFSTAFIMQGGEDHWVERSVSWEGFSWRWNDGGPLSPFGDDVRPHGGLEQDFENATVGQRSVCGPRQWWHLLQVPCSFCFSWGTLTTSLMWNVMGELMGREKPGIDELSGVVGPKPSVKRRPGRWGEMAGWCQWCGQGHQWSSLSSDLARDNFSSTFDISAWLPWWLFWPRHYFAFFPSQTRWLKTLINRSPINFFYSVLEGPDQFKMVSIISWLTHKAEKRTFTLLHLCLSSWNYYCNHLNLTIQGSWLLANLLNGRIYLNNMYMIFLNLKHN